MSTRTVSLLGKVIDRISHGSVPVDGGYWFDSQARLRSSAPGRERSRIPSLSSQPLTRQRCTP